MKLWVILIIIASSVSACSGSSGKGGAESYEGNVVELHNRFFTEGGDYLSQRCDIDLKDKKTKLLTDLQSKHADLVQLKNSYYAKESGDKNGKFEILNFGPAKFSRERFPVQHKDVWQESDGLSWYNIIKYYEKILANPKASLEDWYDLDIDVRNILPDDQSRILELQNMSLGRRDKENLKLIMEITESCIENNQCSKLELSASLEAWVQSKSYYPLNLKKIRSASSQDEFKKRLRTFNADLNFDYDKFKLRHNNHKVDKESSTLTVHMDLNAFAPDQRKLADYLQAVWSVEGINIRILTSRDPSYSFYKIVLNSQERRGVVYHERHLMYLNPNTSIQNLIHEFGHVLGLRDEYYTIWNEDSCSYKDEYNKSNLMSGPPSINVKSQHIKALKELYFSN
ncbi:MAG: hypothetical protein V4596_11520 [Bdellovibrionota bacterium]